MQNITILDTYKPLFFAVTCVALTAAAVDAGGFPSSAQWFVAVGVGASISALWHFGVMLFLSYVPILPNANWETPPTPQEPLETAQEAQSEPQRVDNQPVRQEARTGQPVALQPQAQPKRESMPNGVVAVLRAIDGGHIVPPLSLNKLDQIGVSRSQPRPVSDAHTVLNWLRDRGIIDGSGNFTATIPSLNSLPYPIDLSE